MDGFFTLVRWLDRHLRGFYADVGAYLIIGFTVCFAALAGYLLLARAAAGAAIQRVDVAVLWWVRDLRTPALDVLALFGTVVGSGPAAYLVLGVSAVLFWRSGRHLSALILVATLVGERALIALLKNVYDRPRPGLFGDRIEALGMTFEYPESASFPSGHAITAVAVFGTLAYLVARLEPTAALRRATIGGALALVAIIGFSRIYFAVHYPTDVVAGLLVGLVWASVCAFTLELAAYIARRRREELPQEEGVEEGLRPLGRWPDGGG